MAPESPGLERVTVERLDGPVEDAVAVEEPLEIRVDGVPLAITLRTPGDDAELVAGFLHAEGVVAAPSAIEALQRVDDPSRPGAEQAFGVLLRQGAGIDRQRLSEARRDFLASAACGVCGKPSLASLERRLPPLVPLTTSFEDVLPLPGRMRAGQRLFAATGGIHAAALFDPGGRLLTVREDVGRHNAVDKLIGRHFLDGSLPLRDRILVVSGRAGFEVVQKALMAAVPVMVSVGAASSLAVRLAKAGGMALYSFVDGERGNRMA